MGKHFPVALLSCCLLSTIVGGYVVSLPDRDEGLATNDPSESELLRASWYRVTSEEIDDLRLLGVRKEEVPVLLELYYLVKVLQAYRSPTSWGSYTLNGAIERLTDKELVLALERLLRKQRFAQEIALIGMEGTEPDRLQVQLANDERLLYPFLIGTLRKVLGLKKADELLPLVDKDDFLGTLLLDMQQEWFVLREAVRQLEDGEFAQEAQDGQPPPISGDTTSEVHLSENVDEFEADLDTQREDIEGDVGGLQGNGVLDGIDYNVNEDVGNLMLEDLTDDEELTPEGNQDVNESATGPVEDQARRDHNRGSSQQHHQQQQQPSVLIIQQTTTVTEAPAPRPNPVTVYKPVPSLSMQQRPNAAQFQVNQMATQADKVAIDLIATELDKFLRVVEELSGVDELTKELDLFDRSRMVGWIKQRYVPTVGLDQRDFIRALRRLLRTKQLRTGRREVLQTLQYLQQQLDRDDRTRDNAATLPEADNYFSRVYGSETESVVDVVGGPCGYHGSYTFYKGLKVTFGTSATTDPLASGGSSSSSSSVSVASPSGKPAAITSTTTTDNSFTNGHGGSSADSPGVEEGPVAENGVVGGQGAPGATGSSVASSTNNATRTGVHSNLSSLDRDNLRPLVLALGDCIPVRPWSDSPIACLAELRMVWRDRNEQCLLIALRLYFLPENTPSGRNCHGEL
uniref:Uncharacterized protein n=1 Tax=Anopheles atroparvus TaxID=41427 RepID=A0A182J7F0_ANOAO